MSVQMMVQMKISKDLRMFNKIISDILKCQETLKTNFFSDGDDDYDEDLSEYSDDSVKRPQPTRRSVRNRKTVVDPDFSKLKLCYYFGRHVNI